MLTLDWSISDYAQCRQILERHADTRLARSLRHHVPLHHKCAQAVLHPLPVRVPYRIHLVKHWDQDHFVDTKVALPRTA